MALSTTHVTGAAKIIFKIGSTQYECDVTNFAEVETRSGGETLDTGCGTITNPIASVISGCSLSIVQGLQAAQIMQYLRANVSAGTETLKYCFGTSITPSSTNPVWTATLTGWTTPPLKWSRGPIPTTDCEFSFAGAPTVAFS